MKRTVAILGLGPSLTQYLELAKRVGGTSAIAHEVWGINALGDVLRCDRIFHMDDVRIQEIRAEAQPTSNIANMLGWMGNHAGPIYTSRKRDGYPGLVEFPIEAVANDIGIVYFNSTAAYALALAIYEKFEKVVLFGCDFTYPDAHHAERGRACVEFLLGIAHSRGIEIALPRGTSLMDALHPFEERTYGMNGSEIKIENVDGDRRKFKVSISDRANMPTADEIEAAYDHGAHPNPLVNGG